jgi:hypothetical protein
MPWVIDLTLLLRIVAVYPPPSSSRRVLVAALGLPLIIKVVRLTVVLTGLIKWHATLMRSTELLASAAQMLRSKWAKTEWALRCVDNGYSAFRRLLNQRPLLKRWSLDMRLLFFSTNCEVLL